MGRILFSFAGVVGLLILASCSTPEPIYRPIYQPIYEPAPRPSVQPIPKPGLQLPDTVRFLQTDKRWSRQRIGGSNESIEKEGCLVTATAMALVNLGFETDPGDLNRRLKANGGFNSRGWLVWRGLERATSGAIKTKFYDRKDAQSNTSDVRACLAAGYYPLVRFYLPSGQTHWGVVVQDTQQGFYIRDPMVNSSRPIGLSTRTNTIDAVRCVGAKP